MITLQFPDKNKTIYFPENLAECDEQQYADMSKLLYLLKTNEISYFDFRILAVYALMNMKIPKTIPTALSEGSLKWENLFRLSELVESFFERKETSEGDTIEIKFGYLENRYKVHRFFRKYYGPEDGFRNVTFGEYIDGLEEYIYFTETGEIESLRLLFSIFYRAKGEVYNIEKSRKRANGIFKYTDIRHLYGFYLFFTSMQHYILSGQLSVMGSEIDLSIIYQDSSEEKKVKSDIPGIGMHSILHDLAESGVFGNYNEVRQTNMWTILIRLYELKKRRLDELKEESQKQNKV